MSDSNPGHWPNGFFNACLLILGGFIALSLAVDILRCIWPWIVIALVVAGLVYAVIWWIRQRANRW